MTERASRSSAVERPLRRLLQAAGPQGIGRWLRPGNGFAVDAVRPVHTEVHTTADKAHGAVRQQITLTNRAKRLSSPMNNLHILDLPLAVTLNEHPRAYTFGGMAGMENTGCYPPPAYMPREFSFGAAPEGSQALHPLRWWGGHRHLEIGSGPDGRGSIPNLPVMMFTWHTPTGGLGFWISLEWSGLWKMEVLSGEDGRFRIIASVPVNNLTLEKGECLKLPTVHIGSFRGDAETGTNAVRRYTRDVITPAIDGCRPEPFLAYDHWMGIHGDLDERSLKPQVAAAVELGLEYFVVDAGWFAGMEKGWVNAVGNWDTENRAKFPRGLGHFADYVRSYGLKFGLWFEPERAMPGTEWLKKHPEWFLSRPGNSACCLDLGQPEAADALIAMLSTKIENLGIKWLRWDNNQSQGPYWAARDASGKYQFCYVAGLYRVWDVLRQRFPDLVLDLGWRMDFGSMKRGATTIMADYAEDRHIVRSMLTGGARTLPANFLNGFTYQGRGERLVTDPADLISRMAGSITLGGWISRYSAAERRTVRKYLDGYRRFRGLLAADFHALTPFPLRPDEPDIVEFVERDGSAAVVLAFTAGIGLKKHMVAPKGLRPGTMYAVTDPFSGKVIAKAAGRTLRKQGLVLSLAPHAAAVRYLTAVKTKRKKK